MKIMNASVHQIPCTQAEVIATMREQQKTILRGIEDIQALQSKIFDKLENEKVIGGQQGVMITQTNRDIEKVDKRVDTLVTRLWTIGVMSVAGLAGSLWSIFTGSGGKP